MKFEDIDKARKILGLGESATLEEIKNAYYNLVKKFHPDKCRDKDKKECEQKLKKINWAFEIIKDYIYSYRISFSQEEFQSHFTDTEKIMREHMERFFNGWWADI